MNPLTIWSNHHFSNADTQALEQEVAPHTVVWSKAKNASNLTPGASDPSTAEADILFGQPAPADVLAADRVKWVQLTSAGYTRYSAGDFFDRLRERRIAICNAS